MNEEPTNIPDLTFGLLGDGPNSLIRLGQDCSNDHYSVDIHPIQLRHMAEQFGLVATSDPLAQKTIDTLTRRLRLLRDRIEHLDDLLKSIPCFPPGSDRDSAEELSSGVLLELANEFCAELDPESSEVGEPQ